MLLATSRAYMFVPVTGPLGTDLTQYPVELALIADTGTEPADADYHAGQWLAPDTAAGKQAALLVGPGGGGVTYLPGEYMAYVRITAGLERPVLRAGRVRIGDQDS